MTLKLIDDTPPNYDRIVEAFPYVLGMKVFFAYAPAVYSPSGVMLPKVLVNHEKLHIRRQGDNPAAWWDRYIDDIDFRREEELLAHVAEYRDRVIDMGNNRSARRHALAITAERLANPLYGPIYRKAEALKAIKAKLKGESE